MNLSWTTKDKHPSKLYRVCHSFQHTKFNSQDGLRSTDISTYYQGRNSVVSFFKSVQNHREQAPRKTPYISAFADKIEAESWALAAEEVFGEETYLMEIDLMHDSMKCAKIYFVQGLLEASRQELGLGGARNSEWLILYLVPRPAIYYPVKFSTQIRIERGLEFPIGTEIHDTIVTQTPKYDISLYFGARPLECVCWRMHGCKHTKWCEDPFQGQHSISRGRRLQEDWPAQSDQAIQEIASAQYYTSDEPDSDQKTLTNETSISSGESSTTRGSTCSGTSLIRKAPSTKGGAILQDRSNAETKIARQGPIQHQ